MADPNEKLIEGLMKILKLKNDYDSTLADFEEDCRKNISFMGEELTRIIKFKADLISVENRVLEIAKKKSISFDFSPFPKLKELWEKIKTIRKLRTPLAEQQEMYLEVLTEFSRIFNALTPENQTIWQSQMNVVQAEISRINNQINLPQSDEEAAIAESLKPQTAGRRYRITTGYSKEGNSLARIEYLYNFSVLPQENNAVILDYWQYTIHPNGGPGTFEPLRLNVRSIRGELTVKLLSMAIGKLTPGGTSPDSIPGPEGISMYDSGSYYLSIQEMGQLCLPHILIQDGPVSILATDSCGNTTQLGFTRTASLLPNPHCDRQKIFYQNLVSINQVFSTQFQLGTIANGEGSIPLTAIQGTNFNLPFLSDFLQKKETYTEQLAVNIAAPQPVVAGQVFPILVNFWLATLTNPTATLTTLTPVIDFLNYYCKSTIMIVGQLTWFPQPPQYTNPWTDLYTPANRATFNIPTNIVNPIDYIYVKGQNVANLLLNSGLLRNPSQIIVPTRAANGTNGNIPMNMINIGPNNALGNNVLVIVNFVPNN